MEIIALEIILMYVIASKNTIIFTFQRKQMPIIHFELNLHDFKINLFMLYKLICPIAFVASRKLDYDILMHS